SQPGVGNINPRLYGLAQNANSPFHDIVKKDNKVPCTPGTLDCTSGTFGFTAGPGYDQVTGLGSVDAYKLITNWAASPSLPTTTTVTAAPTTIAATGSTVLTATVIASSGTDSPAGNVTFTSGAKNLGSATLTGSGGFATASLTAAGSQFANGNDVVTAKYAGNTSFNSSQGTVTVVLSTVTG